MSLETLGEQACFDGRQGHYRHASRATGLPMQFSVYVPQRPPGSEPLPVLFYLAGLTCNEETFMTKAGAQRVAARCGVILVAPDTSPRDTGIAGVDRDWDFGNGAGFYLDATESPWSSHFRMHEYVVHELPSVIIGNFPADPHRMGIFGHSMGGHGALVLALRNPGVYGSVSALAPIAAPSSSPWGQKALGLYLGSDRSRWLGYDATALMEASRTPYPNGILVDQGLDDKFLNAGQLLPDRFEAACSSAQQPLTLRRHAGYDHGYYFISTFIEDHVMFHATRLRAAS